MSDAVIARGLTVQICCENFTVLLDAVLSAIGQLCSYLARPFPADAALTSAAVLRKALRPGTDTTA